MTVKEKIWEQYSIWKYKHTKWNFSSFSRCIFSFSFIFFCPFVFRFHMPLCMHYILCCRVYNTNGMIISQKWVHMREGSIFCSPLVNRSVKFKTEYLVWENIMNLHRFVCDNVWICLHYKGSCVYILYNIDDTYERVYIYTVCIV